MTDELPIQVLIQGTVGPHSTIEEFGTICQDLII